MEAQRPGDCLLLLVVFLLDVLVAVPFFFPYHGSAFSGYVSSLRLKRVTIPRSRCPGCGDQGHSRVTLDLSSPHPTGRPTSPTCTVACTTSSGHISSMELYWLEPRLRDGCASLWNTW